MRIALCLAVALAVSPAALAQPAAGSVPLVTVAVASSTDMSLMIVAVKKGFLQKQGPDAQLQLFDSPPDEVSVKYMAAPDQVPAMARGDIDGFFSCELFLTKAADTIPKTKVYSRTIDDGFVLAGNVVMREDMAKNQKDIAVKVVKGLIETANWMKSNPMEAAKVVDEVQHAPSIEQLNQQIQYLDWPADFRRKTYDQEVSIADWGVGIGLFPAKDGRKLVDEMVYPAIIK